MAQAPTRDIAAARPAQRRRWLNRDRLTAILMILPSAIAIAIFVYGFIGWTGYVSLTRWTGITPDFTFVGLKNYADIFNTPRFQTDIRNTVVFTAFFLVGCLGLGLLLAMLIDRPMPVRPHPVSKLNTVAQIVLAATVLGSLGLNFDAGWALPALMGLVTILTLLSIGFYVAEWIRHFGTNGAVK